MPETAHNLAVFIDLENVVIGARDAGFKSFDIGLVLRRIVEKGNIVVKRAYADWSRFEREKRQHHEASIDLIDMSGSKLTGKNSADIKMVVDAIEMAFTKPHIDTFALVSGDSDFSPLVTKLRENNKRIIGVGVKSSTSPLLIDNCDEFLLYDDLAKIPERRQRKRREGSGQTTKEQQEAFDLLMEAIEALQREDKDVMQASLVKDTIRRKQPQFNEGYHGYKSFTALLLDAQKRKLITLAKDPRSGTYLVSEAE